jgi:capsular polysaccharide biosynthesis protein
LILAVGMLSNEPLLRVPLAEEQAVVIRCMGLSKPIFRQDTDNTVKMFM